MIAPAASPELRDAYADLLLRLNGQGYRVAAMLLERCPGPVDGREACDAIMDWLRADLRRLRETRRAHKELKHPRLARLADGARWDRDCLLGAVWGLQEGNAVRMREALAKLARGPR